MSDSIGDRIRGKQKKAGKGKHTNNGQAEVDHGPPPWERPLPLAEAPTPTEFPSVVLPGAAWRFVDEAAAALHCPPDYLALPALVLAGAAVGASRALEVKPGWCERPALYGAVVAPPGTAKSPAVRTAAAPLYREQARLHEKYRRDLQDYQEAEEKGARPAEVTLCVSDVTTEKLAEVLHANRRGVVMVRDELTALVSSMNQYKGGGKGADRQFYLSAWAGEPVIVHRKGQQAGSVFVEHPFLAIVGGLPPDLLSRLRGERDVSDGWMDRILFAYPEPPRAVAEDWCCVCDETAAAWATMLADLRGLQTEKGEHGERPRFVRLTASGRQAWEEFTGRLADEVNEDGFPDCLRGPWSKLRGYGARLALIIQMMRLSARKADGEDVDGQSVSAADALVVYFQSHARKVYAVMGTDREVEKAKRVLGWIVRERKAEFKRWESYEDLKSVGQFPSVDSLDEPLGRLVRHHYLRLRAVSRREGPGRSPAPTYEVNPQLLQRPENPVNPGN
jgi:hypothetical protein